MTEDQRPKTKDQRPKTEDQEGIYIYCIIESNKPWIFKSPGIGKRRDPVYMLSRDGLGAVVSQSPQTRYQALRDNLMAHELVVEEAMQEFTTLPVRFCTIAKDENEVIEKGLKRFEADLKDLIEKMRDKVELGVRAMWTNMEKVFEEIAETPEVKKLKSFPNPNLVEIGRQVQELVGIKQENERERLLAYFKKMAVDYKLNNTYGDPWIMNAAFLVEKSREEDFDAMVEKCQTEFEDNIKLKYVGPLAPYNFANVELMF